MTIRDNSLQSIYADYEVEMTQKYGVEVVEESRLKPDDTPNTFRDRLFRLYPSDYQRAYIAGLMEVAHVATYGLRALQSFAYNEYIHPKVLLMFPEGVNEEVKGAALRTDGWVDIPLVISNDAANDLITACNLAALYVKKRGDCIVKEQQTAIINAILGGDDIKDLPVRSKLQLTMGRQMLRLGNTLLGMDAFNEDFLRRHVNELISHEYLGLFTKRVAKRFKEISNMVTSKELDPIKLLADVTVLSFALDNLDIYLHDHTDLISAWERTIDN